MPKASHIQNNSNGKVITVPRRLLVLTLATPPAVGSSCGCRLTGGQSGSAEPLGHWKGIFGSGQHENIQNYP